jgi:hypothetical protein
MPINNGIINQKGTPAFYSDIFANRPAFGYAGRVFISTDTGAIYEDTGSAWTLIADAGAGTTGTLQQVTTNGNTTTLGVTIEGLTIGKGTGSIASNTAIGNLALNSNTTGSVATAIGKSALQNNTSGTGNTAIGSSALFTNSIGLENTGVGANSLYSNTSGMSNTAIGSSSLYTNSIGFGNTAIGTQSLFSNTTGSRNTAIGNASLNANIIGADNTAIGNSALNTNTGSNNTAIGSSALSVNTTGTLNTAIGKSAGSLITTGSNNTILGNYVGTAALTSNIVLSDGAGNVRLFSDANGLIAINQAVGSVPGGQIDVHTTQTYALVLNGLTTNNAYIAFSNNSVGQWRFGNNYNAGANSFDIFNLGTSSTIFSINKTTNLITLGSNSYVNGNVGIGSTPTATIGLVISRNITGAVTSYGTFSNGSIQSDVTTTATYHATFIGTATASFTVNNAYGHYVAQTTIGAGSAISTQQAYYAHSNFTSATNNYGFRGAIPSGTNRWNLYLDGSAANYMAGALGIGSTSLTNRSLHIGKTITGSTVSFAVLSNGAVQSDVTSQAYNFISSLSTAAAAFTLPTYYHFIASQGTIGSTSAVTNQYGFVVENTLIGATNNYGFQGSIPSGTNRWNLYMDGTASNYLNGILTIGTASPNASAKVQVDSTTQGFLPPRMTTTEKNAISSPATGLVIFDTTLGKLCVFSTTWQTITSV